MLGFTPLNNIGQAGLHAGVNTAVWGGSFNDHLKTSLENQGNDVLSALAFYQAGNLAQAQGWQEGGLNKTLLHGLVGGAVTEITHGDFATGASAAALNQLATPVLENFAKGASGAFNWTSEEAWRTAGSQLAGLTGAAMAGGDMNAGAWIAKQADAYNRQLHKTELKVIAENYKEYAKQRGISEQQAFNELVYVSMTMIDEAAQADDRYRQYAGNNNYDTWRATMFLMNLSYSHGGITHNDGETTLPFTATPEQFANSKVNSNHLREIEDGYYGEMLGLV